MDAASVAAFQIQNNGVANSTSQGVVPTRQNELGMDDFFKLLTTQLVNQDPLQPMQDTEFIAQMANFSSLAQMETIATNMKTLREQQEGVAVQNLIGKEIVADLGDGDFVRGIVSSVARVDGQLVPFIGNQQIPFLQIVEISEPAAAADPDATAPETEESGS